MRIFQIIIKQMTTNIRATTPKQFFENKETPNIFSTITGKVKSSIFGMFSSLNQQLLKSNSTIENDKLSGTNLKDNCGNQEGTTDQKLNAETKVNINGQQLLLPRKRKILSFDQFEKLYPDQASSQRIEESNIQKSINRKKNMTSLLNSRKSYFLGQTSSQYPSNQEQVQDDSANNSPWNINLINETNLNMSGIQSVENIHNTSFLTQDKNKLIQQYIEKPLNNNERNKKLKQYPLPPINNNRKRGCNVNTDGQEKQFIRSHVVGAADYQKNKGNKYVKVIQSSRQEKKFDDIVKKTFDRLIQESMNQQRNQSKQKNQKSLLSQYQNFVKRNFRCLKKTQQMNNQLFGKSKEFKDLRIVPIEAHPKIPKRKLYTFTKEHDDKIDIRSYLKQIVTESKEQERQERIRQEAQQQKIKAQLAKQAQIMRKKQQQKQEQERKRQQKINQTVLFENKAIQDQQLTLAQQNNSLFGKSLFNNTPKIDQKKDSSVPQNNVVGDIEQGKTVQDKPQNKQVVSKELSDTPQVKQNVLFPVVTPQQNTTNNDVPNQLQIKKSPNQQQKKVKYNPFLSKAKADPKAPSILQNLVKNSNQESYFLKSAPTEDLKPIQNPSSFLSPVRQNNVLSNQNKSPSLHNHNSHYSNLDSSMCQQQSESVTPIGAQNSSQLNQQNNSFLSGTSYSNNTPANSMLFGQSLSGGNTGFQNNNSLSSNTNYNTGGMHNLMGNQQSTSMQKNHITNNIPSFLTSDSPFSTNLNSSLGTNMFMIKSPSKQQTSLFGSVTPQETNRRSTRQERKRNKKDERIR